MLWTQMTAGFSEIDFAAVDRRDDWLHHPVFGDPSWDNFERAPENPVVRGAAPLEWPVNCFLFIDPVSGDWFLYVGHYTEGYVSGPGVAEFVCRVSRSRDQGKHWEQLGPIFPPGPFAFEDDPVGALVGGAPDVSVCYHDGRYHLSYDWLNARWTWQHGHRPEPGIDSGIAYAWSDRPEGPFHRHPRPICRCGERAAKPVLGKYARIYAQTLIRRRDDWLILAMSDAGLAMSWALVALTAPKPEGPYGDWTFLKMVDSEQYHPPLMEFFPAFVHEGYVYAPATSVALNRNFVMVFRAPLEQAHDPRAWEAFQHGSTWHSENVENEHFGLWGQVFSGAVDRESILHAAFPSRDSNGMGTINLASRPWKTPSRERGFRLSGHQGSSLTLLRHAYRDFTLSAGLQHRGTCRILWDYAAPLGPDKPAPDASLHPLSLTRHGGLELSETQWRLLRLDAHGAQHIVAEGTLAANGSRQVTIHREDGTLTCTIDGLLVWRGEWASTDAGPIGLLAGSHSFVSVEKFAIAGDAVPAGRTFLWTEALLGAGTRAADWQTLDGPLFRYGGGAKSLQPNARAKWNFHGKAFTLWSPSGPGFGRVEIRFDGKLVGEVDLHNAGEQPSRPVFHFDGFENAEHAVVLSALSGPLVVDSLVVEDVPRLGVQALA